MGALAARPDGHKGAVPFMETVRHPAFDTSVVVSGEYSVDADGGLVRQQLHPRGDRLIIHADRILTFQGGKEVVRPLPENMKPLLDVLRMLVLGAGASVPDSQNARMRTSDKGWAVTLDHQMSGARVIVVSGCGDRLLSLEIAMGGGQIRLISFGAP